MFIPNLILLCWVAGCIGSPFVFRCGAEEPATAVGPKTIKVDVKYGPKDAQWEAFDTTTLALSGYTIPAHPPQTDPYGGWLAKKDQPTGFFHVKQIDGRWWLIDPEGYYFLQAGVAAVAPDDSETVGQTFSKKFTSKADWAERTTTLLRDNGFNGAGAWSDTAALRQASRPVAYTIIKHFMAAFVATKAVTGSGAGHGGLAKDCLPVFDPDFPEFCDHHAEDLAATKADPWLLGIFSDNELPLPHIEKYLELNPSDPAQKANYLAAKSWITARLGRETVTAADLTKEIHLEFAGYVFGKYFESVSRAIRKHDPNHMYIGSRFLGAFRKARPVWIEAGKYADCLSINYYRAWEPNPSQVENWTKWSGKPVIISEWYAKGDDVGYPNTGGIGWLVKTQADRGKFYQNFVLGCLKSKTIVGWHWFRYMDNDLKDDKADSSNRDSNKGIVRVDFTVYEPLLDQMREINREIYPLTEFYDQH